MRRDTIWNRIGRRLGRRLGLRLGALLFLIGMILVLAPQRAWAQDPVDDGIYDALNYLKTQQLESGAIDSFGMGADASGTAEAIMAIVASGRDAQWLTHETSGNSATDYLAHEAVTYTHEADYTAADKAFPGRLGLLLTAVAAANEDPYSYGGMDAVQQLQDCYVRASGAYSTTASQGWTSGEASAYNQAWAMLGLTANGIEVPAAAGDYLEGIQEADGSWDAADPDTTGIALLALLGSGTASPSDEVVQNALGFFRDNQLPSGGWRPSWDTDPASANSTGLILQALVVAGYLPPTETWRNEGSTPIDALLDMQAGNGCIGGAHANAFSTIEAVLGLSQEPIYLLGRDQRARLALSWLAEQQAADGSWDGSAGQTCDAVLAYAAAGYDPASVEHDQSGLSAMDYLSNTAASFVQSGASEAGKLAIVAASAGEDPHDFGNTDVMAQLQSWYSDTTGIFIAPGQGISETWRQGWGILGLAAGGETVPITATDVLAGLQADDGSWSDAWGFQKVDSTGLALQALAGSGHQAEYTQVISDAVAFLASQQLADAGWGNANSNAYAMQGLLSLGEDLIADWSGDTDVTPYAALAGYQKPDGPFVWMWESPWGPPTDNAMATRQAVPALLSIWYPNYGVKAAHYRTSGLVPFEPVVRGADPDRLVMGSCQVDLGDTVNVRLSYGSDLNQDGALNLSWCGVDDAAWRQVDSDAVVRGEGLMTATFPVTYHVGVKVSATISDTHDGVQMGDYVTETVTSIWRKYVLPLIYR